MFNSNRKALCFVLFYPLLAFLSLTTDFHNVESKKIKMFLCIEFQLLQIKSKFSSLSQVSQFSVAQFCLININFCQRKSKLKNVAIKWPCAFYHFLIKTANRKYKFFTLVSTKDMKRKDEKVFDE